MKWGHWFVAAGVACAATLASAQQLRVYDSAEFVPVDDGVELLGFGRGGTLQGSPPTGGVAGPSFAASLASVAAGRELFIDTWNVRVDSVAAGQYSFANVEIDATGSVVFDTVVFNSYDAAGARHQILFTIDAAGTQAVGSGTFTVLAKCPVQSCVWFDVIGTQDTGSLPVDGYAPSGRVVAAAVAEPATLALWASGLALLAGIGAARRSRS